eukprot:UN06991
MDELILYHAFSLDLVYGYTSDINFGFTFIMLLPSQENQRLCFLFCTL